MRKHSDTQFCLVVGLVMHVVGSIGINVGQNLQSLGVHNLGKEGRDTPCRSTMFVVGLVLFLFAGVVTFAALAFAPASILLPLESVQFVVNILFNRCVRGRPITYLMYVGTACVIGGIVLFLVFGPLDEVNTATANQTRHAPMRSRDDLSYHVLRRR
jgi:drug/metabolite transporter (DMT)-like permease